MKREFEFDQRVERSILTTYRKELWKPFILAVKRYELIQEGVYLRRQGFHADGQADAGIAAPQQGAF